MGRKFDPVEAHTEAASRDGSYTVGDPGRRSGAVAATLIAYVCGAVLCLPL